MTALRGFALLRNLNPCLHTHVNVNDPDVNWTPMIANGLDVDGTPLNVNGPIVDWSQTNWTRSQSDLPH